MRCCAKWNERSVAKRATTAGPPRRASRPPISTDCSCADSSGMSPLRCVCLTGPTACGKTEIALGVADALPVEIVSMDSAMVYRGMDIGTAKPSTAVRERVRHHLVDVVDPSEPYSAGRFARDALAAIRDITQRGKLPLVVGGTLLYLRA